MSPSPSSQPSSAPMAPPPPSNAWSSFASLRARQQTWTYLLRIDGFSAADRMVPAGDSIDSRAFSAGGRRWQLSYYPNGCKSYHDKRGPATVELRLKDGSYKDDGPVMAGYRVSILDRDGNPAYSYAVGPQSFDAGTKYRHRVSVLATPEERKAALRLVEKDDSLTVRCDISMTTFVKESRLKWYLRKLLED